MKLTTTAFKGGEMVKWRGARCDCGWAQSSDPVPPNSLRVRRAFTLIELLVVMAIIGILASVGLPALRGLKAGTDVNTANRQLVDDLAFARFKAINDRTTVYVVFVPPLITKTTANFKSADAIERDKLINGQYTAYALFAKRSLGDQPGPGRARYLTEWRRLPEGVFIATNEFLYYPNSLKNKAWQGLSPTNRPLPYISVPFPTAASPAVELPCVAFDYQGRLVHPGDEIIRLSKGSLIFPLDAAGKKYILADAEVIETPKGSYTNNPNVRIDWLTGRARIEQPPPRT